MNDKTRELVDAVKDFARCASLRRTRLVRYVELGVVDLDEQCLGGQLELMSKAEFDDFVKAFKRLHQCVYEVTEAERKAQHERKLAALEEK